MCVCVCVSLCVCVCVCQTCVMWQEQGQGRHLPHRAHTHPSLRGPRLEAHKISKVLHIVTIHSKCTTALIFSVGICLCVTYQRHLHGQLFLKVPDIVTFCGKYTRALSFENVGQESGKYLDTVGLLGCSTTVSKLN